MSDNMDMPLDPEGQMKVLEQFTHIAKHVMSGCEGPVPPMPLDADPQEVAASTTNDPQAVYGKKREPMLSDEEIEVMRVAESHNFKAGEPPTYEEMMRRVRDHYEALLASGELIVKSELVIHLKAFQQAADMANAERPDMRHGIAKLAIQSVLDHLNKKTT